MLGTPARLAQIVIYAVLPAAAVAPASAQPSAVFAKSIVERVGSLIK
jgi:hypothetical protein